MPSVGGYLGGYLSPHGNCPLNSVFLEDSSLIQSFLRWCDMLIEPFLSFPKAVEQESGVGGWELEVFVLILSGPAK